MANKHELTPIGCASASLSPTEYFKLHDSGIGLSDNEQVDFHSYHTPGVWPMQLSDTQDQYGLDYQRGFQLGSLWASSTEPAVSIGPLDLSFAEATTLADFIDLSTEEGRLVGRDTTLEFVQPGRGELTSYADDLYSHDAIYNPQPELLSGSDRDAPREMDTDSGASALLDVYDAMSEISNLIPAGFDTLMSDAVGAMEDTTFPSTVSFAIEFDLSKNDLAMEDIVNNETMLEPETTTLADGSSNSDGAKPLTNHIVPNTPTDNESAGMKCTRPRYTTAQSHDDVNVQTPISRTEFEQLRLVRSTVAHPHKIIGCRITFRAVEVENGSVIRRRKDTVGFIQERRWYFGHICYHVTQNLDGSGDYVYLLETSVE